MDFSSEGGDPLRFGLEEGAIEAFLSARGFHEVKDISGDFYEDSYFEGPNRNRKGCYICRVVSAMVNPGNEYIG